MKKLITQWMVKGSLLCGMALVALGTGGHWSARSWDRYADKIAQNEQAVLTQWGWHEDFAALQARMNDTVPSLVKSGHVPAREIPLSRLPQELPAGNQLTLILFYSDPDSSPYSVCNDYLSPVVMQRVNAGVAMAYLHAGEQVPSVRLLVVRVPSAQSYSECAETERQLHEMGVQQLPSVVIVQGGSAPLTLPLIRTRNFRALTGNADTILEGCRTALAQQFELGLF